MELAFLKSTSMFADLNTFREYRKKIFGAFQLAFLKLRFEMR